MEEAIASTVLWSWLVGCGIWAWNQYQQTRWDQRQPAEQKTTRARYLRRVLSGLLLAALGVISWYWSGTCARSWLLPIPGLDRPLLNSLGLLVIRLAVCWLVVATVQREQENKSVWQQMSRFSEGYRHWEPYHNRQIAVAIGGLMLGLFMALLGLVTAALCLVGWWLIWQLWQTYESV